MSQRKHLCSAFWVMISGVSVLKHLKYNFNNIFYQYFICNFSNMKKIKQTFFRDFPTQAQNVQSSGCREFEGEDLKYESRKEFFKNKQKQWLDEQMEEKRQRQQQQRLQNQMYAKQTQELNRMRGLLEDNFQKTKSDIKSNVTNYNLQLDLQRKQKEEAERQARLNYQKEETEYLKQRGAKQDFYMDVK